MSGPRVQTRFSQTGNHGNARGYSWVQTPVEMRNQQSGPENIPPLPIIPDSLRQAQEPAAAQTEAASSKYQYEQEADPNTRGPHPSQFASYADATPVIQAPNPQNQWRTTPIPPSPGPIPPKTDLPSSHEATVPVHIAPDGNPLTPTIPNQPHDKLGSTTYSPQAAISADHVHNNHYPGQVPDHTQQIKGGTWKYGLCDCSDVGTCCTGLFCPCILYGKTQYRLTQKSDRKDPTNMLGYETLNGSCVVYALLCGCNLFLAAIQHTRVRKNYEIPGSVGNDCVRSMCCSCCTLAQDEKEIKYRESHRSGFTGTAVNSQYATPGGMNYAPPPK